MPEQMLQSELGESLSETLEEMKQKGSGDSLPSTVFAEQQIEEFVARPVNPQGFKVGDYVVRNDKGLDLYKFPDANRNQVAMVVKIFDTPFDDMTDLGTDIIIAVAIDKGVSKFYSVDSRYYKKAA